MYCGISRAELLSITVMAYSRRWGVGDEKGDLVMTEPLTFNPCRP